jgi:hypothetical protein
MTHMRGEVGLLFAGSVWFSSSGIFYCTTVSPPCCGHWEGRWSNSRPNIGVSEGLVGLQVRWDVRGLAHDRVVCVNALPLSLIYPQYQSLSLSRSLCVTGQPTRRHVALG